MIAARQALFITLLTSFMCSVTAARTEPQLETAWRDYLTNDTDLAPSYTFPHAHCFTRAANAHGLPETLLLAVARGESDFEATARSKANAYGVMQILWPGTANHLGIHRLSELYDPCTNIEAGTRYLKELLDQYDGNLHLALAAYNYGPRRIPSDGRPIPSGANWYSGYIYRHLGYVLGERNPARAAPGVRRDYLEDGKLQLAVFAAPFRAEAFVAALLRAEPDLRVDWFRADVNKFRVVLLFDGDADLDASRGKLASAGFPVP